MDLEGNDVRSEKHSPEFDTDSINRAVEKASKDHGFINSAINLIREMKFPAFKKDIISYVKNVNTDRDIVALFESLDGYIEYRDLYHVQKALEENNSEKKKTYQISDQTREQSDVRKRDTTTTAADNSIKDREAVDETEESKLHPEVSAAAMSNFICNICGKPFQNQNDLVQRQRFEGTTPS